MTIELFSGTPGSGKSLHATSLIREYMKYKKLPVIANYELNLSEFEKPEFTYIKNCDLDVGKLIDFAGEYWSREETRFKEDNILLVLDECQLLFNSREWSRSDRMTWLEFFSQHRKYGYRVIFIAQFDRMVDRQIRALIEYEHVHRKLGNMGKGGKFFKLLFLGETFCSIDKYYPLNQKVGTTFLRANKKVMAMYNSYDTFKRDSNLDEDESARREGAEGGSLRRAISTAA